MMCPKRMTWLFFLFITTIVINASASTTAPSSSVDNELNAIGDDNSLWTSLSACKDKDFTSECFKSAFRTYLTRTLSASDVEVTSFLRFTKNNLDASGLRSAPAEGGSEEQNVETNNKSATHNDNHSNPLEEVARSVQDKMKEFFFTHDVELSLPEFVFDGAVIRIAPRALQADGGALVQLDLAAQRRSSHGDVGSPRLFKKLRKFIGERLMWALAALILVVKLLSLKFMFFLPVIMGVAAAKKLLLKVILFVFPFLSHLFKLCPYYAPTKYHHHHHQISHLHHVPHLHDLHAGGIELDHPPPGWHEHHDHHHIDHHGEHHEDFSYYADGPSFGGHEAGLRRKTTYKDPYVDDDEYQGPPGGPPGAIGGYAKPIGPPVKPGKHKAGPLSAAEIENLVLKAEKEAMLKARLQEEQKRVEVENKRLQDKIKNSLKLQEKLKIQSLVAKQTSKFAAALHPPPPPPPSTSPFVPPQMIPVLPHTQAIYPPLPPPVGPASMYPSANMLAAIQAQLQHSSNSNLNLNKIGVQTGNQKNGGIIANKNGNDLDPFYSPILAKIDKIFNELAIIEEPCRERLVCNMYSEPEKYSPHSNLLSAELSRDASELEKPTTSNLAVIRFYKYVQAARDGQDKRDCSTLYPACMLKL